MLEPDIGPENRYFGVEGRINLPIGELDGPLTYVKERVPGMLDTPNADQEREAIGELRFVMSDVECEAVPASLVTLAEQLGEAIAMRSKVEIETA